MYVKAYIYHSKFYVTLYISSNLRFNVVKRDFFLNFSSAHWSRRPNRQHGRICSRPAAATPDAHAFTRIDTDIERAPSPLSRLA